MTKKSFPFYALTVLLSATALSSVAYAAPTEPEISFHPAKPWHVASSGADGVCGMTSEFNNGYVMRFMGANKAPRSIDINFQQDVFVAGKGYESTLTVPGNAPVRAFARAATNGTLSVNISGQKDFFKALSTASVLDLDVEGNNFRFYMTGLTNAAQSFQDCLNGKDPVSAKAAEPVAEPQETIISETVDAAVPEKLAAKNPLAVPPPADISDLINESIAMEEQEKKGEPLVKAELPVPPAPPASPKPFVQPMDVKDTIKLGDQVITEQQAEALQTSPAVRRRMSEELASKIARNPEIVSVRPEDVQNPGSMPAIEPVNEPEKVIADIQDAATSTPEPILKTKTTQAVEAAQSAEPTVLFNGKPVKISEVPAPAPITQKVATKAPDALPVPVVSSEKTAEKPVEQLVQQPVEQPIEKPAEKLVIKPGKVTQPIKATTPETALNNADNTAANSGESEMVRRARMLLARQNELDKAPAGSSAAALPMAAPMMAPVATAAAVPFVAQEIAAERASAAPVAPVTNTPIIADFKPKSASSETLPVASEPSAETLIETAAIAPPVTAPAPAVAPAPAPINKKTPEMIVRTETERMDADFTEVGLEEKKDEYVFHTKAPESIEPASNSYAAAAHAPEARVPAREIDPELIRKISELEASLAVMKKENMALNNELKSSLEAGKTEQVSIASENWNLERASQRYNEAERELKRLGMQLQQERAQCMVQKQELETQLFDPRLTSQEQLAHLAELEQKLMAAEARIRELQGTTTKTP